MHDNFFFIYYKKGKAFLVRFVKTNSCVNIVEKHFPWRNLVFTNWDFLEIKGDLFKYPWSFESFLNNLQKSALQVKSRPEIVKQNAELN